jgi:hypothetical protein
MFEEGIFIMIMTKQLQEIENNKRTKFSIEKVNDNNVKAISEVGYILVDVL